MSAPETETAGVRGLVVGYGDIAVVGPIDLTLRPGVTALLGRNGAGKTTLMRTLCGIIPALAGTCSVLGADVGDGAAVRSRVGYLGHDSALAGRLTVRQNLRFWTAITATYPEVSVVGAAELAARFDLTGVMDTRVSALSRGQRQRVDLARLAMTDPQFLVLDEPLTGLDPVYAAQTRALLREWGRTRTVLYSTHSVPEALELAARFLIIRDRELIAVDSGHRPVTETMILRVLEAHR